MAEPPANLAAVTMSALTLLTGADLPPLGFSGDAPYDPARHQPVSNALSVSQKPLGGLWLSPLLPGTDPPRSVWADHAAALWEVRLHTWPMTVLPDARVLRIDSHADMTGVLAAYPPPAYDLPTEVLALLDKMGGRGFDFEALAATTDALWLTARGAQATRRTCPGMNTWDVETVLVLNPTAVLD